MLSRLETLFATYAARAEAEAKTGAPWTDRTGAARNGLHGSSSVGPGQAELVLSHGVDYGIWLELKNSGAYATVIPTLQRIGPALIADTAGLLG